MSKHPFRRCDYCNTKRRSNKPWNFHQNTRKLSCPDCAAHGQQEDQLAATIIRRHYDLLHLRLAAEPAEPYGDPLHRQYLRVKGQYPDAVLLFRDGDQYIAIADDAIVLERVLGLVLMPVYAGERSIPLSRFPFHALDTYLPALVRSGRRVAICDRIDAGDFIVAAEPFGDAPLPRTHRLTFRGSAEEVDVSLCDGRYYGLDGTWDVATTDRSIRRVVRCEQHAPALYGMEQDPALAAEPVSRYERITRKQVEERLGTLITVLRRHGALPDPRVTGTDERLREAERADRSLWESMPAIRAELRLHRVWLCRHGALHFRLVDTKVNMAPGLLPQMLADYKRMFARSGPKPGVAPARSIGNFTTAEQAERTLEHAEANLRTALQYTWIAPELARHFRKHLADVQARVGQKQAA